LWKSPNKYALPIKKYSGEWLPELDWLVDVEIENQKFPVKSIINPQIINGLRFAIPKNKSAANAIQKITPAIPQFIISLPLNSTLHK
jgi:hypothetical protein